MPVTALLNPVKPIGIISVRGRNGSDPRHLIPDDMCREALNIDWYQSSLGRKRGGAASIAIAGGTAHSTGVRSMARHVPGDDQSLAEFWTVDGALRFHRMAGGNTFADPTVVDAITATPQEVAWQSFNGKLYAAYKSAHNRLHVWDPASNNLRRVGLDLPATPTLGVLAGGAVTDTREYRVSWAVQSGGITVKRSNLSVASGSQALVAQQVPVTRGTPPGEGETHWELWAASTTTGFGDFRRVAVTAIATATVNDNTAALSSLIVDVAPLDGANTPPPSAKFMVADDARIVMAGAYELSTNAENAMVPKNNRVWWTSVLGASDIGDDERVSNTGLINSYADLEEAITGLSEPMQVVSAAANSLERGSFYVFSYRGQWKFVSTGVANVPYLKFRITKGSGCIHHKSIVTAVDLSGNPAIYWASTSGIMRISTNGQEFCGEDVLDIWGTINLDATIPCHSVYHPDKHQIWFYIATGASLYPDTKLVFDTRLGRVTDVSGVRHGWSMHTGESAKAYCSCLFSDTIGVAMGKSLKPYIGYTGATEIWKCDTTDATDNNNLFQGYIESKSYVPWGLGNVGGLNKPAMLMAGSAPGVTIQLTVYRNEGAESQNFLADLSPHSDSAAEELVFPEFGGSSLSESFTIRVRVGDDIANVSQWNLSGVVLPGVYQGER